MIKTGNYNNFKSTILKTVSISEDRGNSANYEGACYPELAPKLAFLQMWHDNIGTISEEENTKFYIEEYYKQVLSKLNPKKVYDDLNHSILLCYENSDEFCHRHIVASWLELLLDEEVSETIIDGYKLKDINRPKYVKEILEEVMKKNKNMRGFTSLRALYLFEESEKLEDRANKLEEQTGRCYHDYRQEACYLRCDADEAEAKYREITRKANIRR